MAVKKKKAVRKSGGGSKELMSQKDWENQLAQYAEQESAKEEMVVGNILSTKGKKFSAGDNVIGEEMDVIIVAYAHEQAYYEEAYDSDNPVPPDCFALSETGKDMVPHENSADPQADTCSECWANKWGSGVNGGKACKERRRLILIDAEATDLEEAEMAALRVAPTGLKAWKSYVKGLEKKLKRPPFSVVTKLSFDEEVDYPKVQYVMDEVIQDTAALQSIMERREEGLGIALDPYEPADAADEEESPKPRRGAKKKASKKKVGKKKKTSKRGSKFSR